LVKSITKSPDVVVIGAGVIGAAIALELARRGYRTLNVDRNPAAGYGPTSASCAIVRFSYSTFEGVSMAWEGSFYWRGWSDYVGDADERGLAVYHRTGGLTLQDGEGRFDRIVELFDRTGVPYELWSGDDVRQRVPYYDLRSFWPPSRPDDPSFWAEPQSRIRSALFTPDAGYVNDPQLATHNLQRAAEAHGAAFRFRADVVEILREHGRVAGVRLGDGERIASPVVVNVAGPHSDVVNRMAGVEGDMTVRTRPLRHEVHLVPAPDGVDFQGAGIYTSDRDSAIYFRPESGNTILVGSEDPECDLREWVEDPDDYDETIHEEQWQAQVYRLARRIPSLPIPREPRGVVSLYDVADDWIPIYDRSQLDGFYMAVGTSGNQFKNAGVAGHLMAELIDACERGHDHDADPVRVTGPYTGLVLDAGFYSRRRTPNPESSFSVNG
jgi:sarcosine oxidase subunit beta